MFGFIGFHLVMMYHFGSSWLSFHVAYLFLMGFHGFFHRHLCFWLCFHCYSIALRHVFHILSLLPWNISNILSTPGDPGGVDAPASGGGPDSFCFQSILLINHCIQQGFGRTSLSIWTCHCLFAGLGLGFVLFQYHLPRCLQTLQFSCVASPAASDSDCTDLDLQLDLGDMDMDDSDGDWTFISQPTPKQKSTPKQVPAYCARNAVSLQQPLQKGGKAVPPFCRPASLTVPVPSVGSSTR